MAPASPDSMESVDRMMDDAMEVYDKIYEEHYEDSEPDLDFEVDGVVESSSEDESVVDSGEVDDVWTENLEEVQVEEMHFEGSPEEENCDIPVEAINSTGISWEKLPVEEKCMSWETPLERNKCMSWETPPVTENSLSWETPPVKENDGADGEEEVASTNAAAGEDYGVDSDGENHVERIEYEISMGVGNIVEDPVRHDVYYESEDDRKEEIEARQERARNFTPRYDGILFKGQKFFNGLAFKEAVLHHALKNQRDIRQERYDKKKLSFSCLGKGKKGIRCSWRVYCSVRTRSATWRIRKISPDHICEKSGDCALLKVTAIARLFVDKIRDEPDHYKPMKIEDIISERWGVSVTRSQTQSARCKALKWIEAEYDDQFRRLRDYGAELRISNPGTTVEVQSYKNSEGEDVFSRFYVCFDALRRSWKATCRPLIGIDGSFLKSKVKGQLLVALGRDGNNQIYPITWGVVDKENTENWEWFVKKLQEDLSLGDGTNFVMVSDRQKGLISAVNKQLPGIEHRHCVRHIYGNMKAKFGKLDPMKKFVWDLSWSYNEAEYTERLEDIRKFDVDVYGYVMKSNPTSWCRSFYKLGPCCEDVENNSTESFNRTVAKARERPFVPMLELIRSQAMSRIAKRNKETSKHGSVLTPYAMEQVEIEEDLAKECKIKHSTSGIYQASLHGCTYCVNLVLKTCSCRKWQIKGIPCEHAYGVILKKNLRVEEYVANWFHAETWMRTYKEGIIVPRGHRFWPKGEHTPLNYPPDAKKMGCKENKRKRGKNESPTKKKDLEDRRVMHCKICGKAGHNSRFHKKENKADVGKGSKRKKADIQSDVGKGSKRKKAYKETPKQKERKVVKAMQTSKKQTSKKATGKKKK